MRRLASVSFFLGFFLLATYPLSLVAQELIATETRELHRARVIKAEAPETARVEGIGVPGILQEVLVEIIEGERKGERIEFVNDFIEVAVGDIVFIDHLRTAEGDDFYSIAEHDRRGVLLFFTFLFVAVFLLIAGWRGIFPLISLAAVFAVIFFLLLPALLSGAPPVLVSIVFSIFIMALVMFITHGIRPSTIAAFLGTTTTLIIVAILAHIAVTAARFSGFADDAAIYLNLTTGGTLNIAGILLGSIIIGVIGVLDDIAITQTALTAELKLANPSLSRAELFRRAMRVGREHISALVNTLALAYAGAALPVLLFFSLSDVSPFVLINREIFAVEILRTAIGSMGLVFAVPLTTWFTLSFIKKKDKTIEEHARHDH